MTRKIRLAYLVTHPIQYQAPLLREIAADPSIELTVFFCSDFSVRGYLDEGFGSHVKWDVPLLEGYQHEFLPAFGDRARISFWRPFNYGLSKRLRDGNFDYLWVHGYARWLNLWGIIQAKRNGTKVLVRDEATLISLSRGPIKRAMKRAFFELLKRCCDGFLAIGSLNRDYYRHYGVQDERIHLVPYAVDNRFFQTSAETASASTDTLRRTLGIAPGRPVILYASKMTERKRPDDLLEAYVSLSPDGIAEPQPVLIYVGEGEMRPALEQRAAELGWNSILFLGFKNQTELPAFFSLCDVFVLPSIHEPWGLVINEVLNAGKAVIVSEHVGCAPDLVQSGKNGYVFKALDREALADCLTKVLQEPAECARMGAESLKMIQRWGFREDIAGLRSACALEGDPA